MNVYMDYLSDEDREYLIEQTIEDNEIQKLINLYEMVCLKDQVYEKEIEYKVLNEAGTYDDYSYLLEEANQEVQQDKQGILQKIWGALVNFFNRIKSVFTKNKQGIAQMQEDQQIEVPEGVSKFHQAVLSSKQDIQAATAAATRGDIAGVLASAGKIAGVFAGIGVVTYAGGAILKKIGKKEAEEIQKETEEASGFFDTISNKIHSLIPSFKNDNKKSDDSNKLGGVIGKIKKTISDVANTIKTALAKLFGKNPDDGSSAAKEAYGRRLAKNDRLHVDDGKGTQYSIERSTGKVFKLENGVENEVTDLNTIPHKILQSRNKALGKNIYKTQLQEKFKTDQAGRKSVTAEANKKFDKEEVGARIYIAGDNIDHIFVGNEKINIPQGTGKRAFKNIIKSAVDKGTKLKNLDTVYDAFNNARKAIEEQKNANIIRDAEEDRISRQNGPGLQNQYPESAAKAKQAEEEMMNGTKKKGWFGRKTLESVNDVDAIIQLMNEEFSGTIFEAVREDDNTIAVLEHEDRMLTFDNEDIAALESEGYEVIENEDEYIIYG